MVTDNDQTPTLNDLGLSKNESFTYQKIASIPEEEFEREMEDAWVKVGESKFGLYSYINKSNRAMPMYELTKKECLYIATKFNDEARAKLIYQLLGST